MKKEGGLKGTKDKNIELKGKYSTEKRCLRLKGDVKGHEELFFDPIVLLGFA
ncbi:hypothetical protein F6Y05_32415 [Bacillus megaterium]|nr:hypothetical protein [Priestia megaterium]